MTQQTEAARFIIGTDDILCELNSLGASIARVRVRNAKGQWTDVALSPESFTPNQPDPSLAGRTIGPCCGRIRRGEICIGHQRLQLILNEGENHIHGGPGGCAFRQWQGEQLSDTRVRFVLTLPDRLDGYPGNRRMTAEYTVSGSTLSILYAAETDRETFVDLTNHVYWDLSGYFDGTAMDQELEIAAFRIIRNDEHHLPVTAAPTEEAFDFLRPDSPRSRISAFPEEEQLRIGRGYNNAFLLDPQLQTEKGFSARLSSPASGLSMTLETDAPAIVLYSGGFLGEETRLLTADGAFRPAVPGCAIALEAQGLPDPFHLPGVQAPLLLPGIPFLRRISWNFR